MRKNDSMKAVYIGGGAVLTIVGLYFAGKEYKKYKIRQENKRYDKNVINLPSPGKGKGSATPLTINTIETAQQLGIATGYAYSAIDPRRWSTNAIIFFGTLAKIPKSVMPKVQEQYTRLYSRNLQLDAKKLLAPEMYSKISYLF